MTTSATVFVIEGRDVPLGGPRAMPVRRTLPHRNRSFVGAWCFLDHYGPDDVSRTGGMDVPPHPHTGLATVSWLFEGTIEHRDSAGVHAMVHPGEVNLMTAGHGIAHSEVSTPDTSTLHGVQLWVALPDHERGAARDFQHHAAPAVEVAAGVRARVFIGSLAGLDSPVTTSTPLLGAEAALEAGTTWQVAVDPTFEHAVLVDHGAVTLEGTDLAWSRLGIVDAGPTTLTIHAPEAARVLVLGGTPFEEPIVMWWNFVGRTHDDIERARREWNSHDQRFGQVDGYAGEVERLPAPSLPGVRLRPRTSGGTRGRAPAAAPSTGSPTHSPTGSPTTSPIEPAVEPAADPENAGSAH